ncbi:hypothetical protein B0T20DRAFT_406528 [Sordaria brevicollis]|uniref:Uncharacterized protein n=1 Tax=Sordaria brevicollis TaxID=83679 RepID=A0AAE0PGI1_SORBR|nr:hypothetical protein B0T20DRAFT_406528 [Sordaria brevicollis]
MIQVLWIKINRQKHMQLLSDNDMEDKDSDNKASFFFRSNVTRKHFTFFVDFLVQEVWRQRVVTTAAATTGSSSRTKTAVGVGAGAAGASGTGPQANNMTGSSSSLSSRQQRPQQPQQIKGEAEAQEMQRMLATWKPFDYNAWFDSKAEWSKHNNNHNNHNNNNNNTKEEGGVDLESALASMYYTLTHTSQKILGRVKNWDVAFISLSEEEEKWFAAGVDGVATSTDKGEVPPGKLSMSPMALGMQEAKRVQEHWERSGKKQWVDPVYPLEWEGWDMMADDGNDEDEWEKWEVV